MSTPQPKPGFWKRLEARGDAWAAKRLSPDEFADAVVLDRKIKKNWGRLLGWLALVILVAMAFILVIWPNLSWRQALFIAGIGSLYFLFLFVSPWYGYRKWSKSPAWRVFAWLVALTLLGAVSGYLVGNWRAGKEITHIDWEKATKAIAIALLAGSSIAGLLVGISRMRLREATQRAARLQAEADGERLARQGAQADLKLLQAQVEPHFLFNTLANVRYLVQTNSPDALAMLDHLIHYLRTSLPEIRSESSTLGREAELARAYLEIMRLRMGNALGIEIDVPADLAHAPFPPLMVMTLVENAIKHGIAPRAGGAVAVRASAGGGKLRVVVEDDGRGLEGGPVGRGVGLANVRERLAALFGAEARLELETRDGGGMRAAIEVPDR